MTTASPINTMEAELTVKLVIAIGSSISGEIWGGKEGQHTLKLIRRQLSNLAAKCFKDDRMV